MRFAVALYELRRPMYRPPGTLRPLHKQAFTVKVEIDQREVGAQAVVVLGDVAISHLVEAEARFRMRNTRSTLARTLDLLRFFLRWYCKRVILPSD